MGNKDKMKKTQQFSAEQLESISKVLDVLTNGEIDKYLQGAQIANIDPVNTKWRRLYNAFANFQNIHQCSNNILTFIAKALAPVRYVNQSDAHSYIITELNKVLIFNGFKFTENGKFQLIQKVNTIREAEQRAGDLKQKLKDRNVHHDILLFCKAELLQDNYFHAVFEASKSLAEKIRVKAMLTEDGAVLVDKAFGLGQTNSPVLSFNSLKTESEENEHKGLMNLLKGVFGMFRNTLAHSPKIKWEINEIDALDSLTIISLLHRKLDLCVKNTVV